MCEQLDGIRDLAIAAEALGRACSCRVEEISDLLHRSYDAALGRPVPPDMLALLGRLKPPALSDAQRVEAGFAPMHAPIWNA